MPIRRPSASTIHPLPGAAEGRKTTTALLLLAVVTIGGTMGFVVIEDWGLWRSFYFTLITITTVGYGDEGISEGGRKFATLLLIGGVASFSYSLATLVQVSVANQLAWKKRMQKRIDQMKEHVTVCGFGRMGASTVSNLEAQGVPFVLIERDPEIFEKAVASGHLAIEGVGTDDDSLLAAGIERATHVIGAVDSVADNIVTAMSARELNPSLVIITRGETEEESRKLKRAGVDRVLSPFRSGGREIADLVTKPNVADFLARASAGGGDVILAEIEICEGSELVGVSLAEYGREEGSRISYVSLDRSGEGARIPPRGSEILKAGDHLIVAGDPVQVGEMGVRASCTVPA
jgi:voltage-gated potassium channel